MKIKIVKKGSFSVKPLASCPWAVDDDGLTGHKKYPTDAENQRGLETDRRRHAVPLAGTRPSDDNSGMWGPGRQRASTRASDAADRIWAHGGRTVRHRAPAGREEHRARGIDERPA